MGHRIVLLLLDLCLIALATICALLLRDNFETRPDQLPVFLPYLAATLAMSSLMLVAFGLNRGIWRMSAMRDYVRVVVATILIVSSTVAFVFLVNRLEGLARSLPIIQGLLMVSVLVGARVFARLYKANRANELAVLNPALNVAGSAENVLVVGINRVTELYLRSVEDLGGSRIKIAGLLGSKRQHVGRLVQAHTVLGTPEDVAVVLKQLEVHGVFVTRIIATTAFESLSAPAQEALLSVERDSDIKVEFFAELIGLGRAPRQPAAAAVAPKDSSSDKRVIDVGPIRRSHYWRVKRVLDVAGAVCAILVIAPVMVLVAMLVAIDLGLPVVFWQQRPGAGGRPFRLFKFRTMASPHDVAGRRVADAERLSIIGRFLRRSRLDELPQLYNVLIGEMSFIGPRPLLPVDQFPALAARLSVRPGLTGWAQVKGGRELSASDKAALDMWYLKHVSLRIDLAILIETVRMVLFGERTDSLAICEAWRELGFDWTHEHSTQAHLNGPMTGANGSLMGSKSAHAGPPHEPARLPVAMVRNTL